jgi:shikimate kinase
MNPENEESSKSDVNHLKAGGNIILLGAMGSGKTTVGWLLSRLVGFGFIDLDERIENIQKKSVDKIFSEQGEAKFREMEKTVLGDLVNLRSHVLSVGGGAVVNEENWSLLRDLGVTVFLDTPPDEIARRLTLHPEEIQKRPLIKEMISEGDPLTKRKLLAERMSALIGNRMGRYKEADLTLGDAFSTPDSSAKCIVDLLIGAGYWDKKLEHQHFDKWDSL